MNTPDPLGLSPILLFWLPVVVDSILLFIDLVVGVVYFLAVEVVVLVVVVVVVTVVVGVVGFQQV